MSKPPLVRVEGKSFGAGSTLTSSDFFRGASLLRSSKSQVARDTEAAFALGDSLYFFAGHACPDFGDVVLAYADPGTWSGGNATPFDTGGFFLRKVCARALDGLSGSEDATAREAYVAAAVCKLPDWRATSASYLSTYFTSVSSYVEGEPPIHDDSTGRLQHPKNERRAWTWEVRLHADQPLFDDLLAVWVSKEFHEMLRLEVLALVDEGLRATWLDRLKRIVKPVDPGKELCSEAEREIATWR